VKIRKLCAILAASSLMLLGACADSGDEGGSSPAAGDDQTGTTGKPIIGLVMKSLGNAYFQGMQAGAEEYAAANTDKFELRSVGTQSETDIDGQIDAVKNMIAQKVDAIVIAPADSQALIAPLKEAADAGIKVINIDVKLDDEALAQAGLDIPFVGPDNVEGARMSGEVLAEALGEGAKVVIIEGISGAANAQQRKAGFDEAVANGKLDLVASQSADWETDKANTVFTNLLTANPDIQGVMCANDSMALGVIAALETAQNTTIKVVGFDNVPEVQPLLDNGKLLATIDQFGNSQAQFGIEGALALLSGGTPEAWVKTKLELIKSSAAG
jgi:ribose transport system substrate-binding protein